MVVTGLCAVFSLNDSLQDTVVVKFLALDELVLLVPQFALMEVSIPEANHIQCHEDFSFK